MCISRIPGPPLGPSYRMTSLLHGGEDPGLPLKVVHAGLDPRLFHHCALGGQIAVKNSQAALWLLGVVQGEDDIVFHQLNPGEIFAHRLSTDRHLLQVQLTLQGLHHRRDPALLLQYTEGVLPGGLDIAEIGDLPAQLIKVIQGDVDARLMGDGGQM